MDIRKMFDDDDSDSVGDSDITLGQLEQILVLGSTEQIEASGDTTTSTSDINSGDSLHKPQAQKKVYFSGVVMEEETEAPELEIDKSKLFSQMDDTFARDTHDAVKHRPVYKRRTRQCSDRSSTGDSEDPSTVSLPRGKRLKKTKSKSTLEEQANSKPEIPEHESNDDVTMEKNLKNDETNHQQQVEVKEEEERGCEDFSHSVRMCPHQADWNSCKVSIHPMDSPSWYNPWINPAWLHSKMRKNLQRRIKEEQQRADEYAKKNLEAAEVNIELKQKLNDQGETISEMKLEVEVEREKHAMQAETISQMEELNADLRENLDKKEEALSEIRELNADLRDNRDGLSMKMEEDKEKHTEEVEHMKQQMELDKDKHTKELQDMSVQVNTFILQSDIIHLTSSQISVHLDFHFSWAS